MSRTMIWTLCWVSLSGAAWLLRSSGAPEVQNLARDLPAYLPSLMLGAAGQFCLYRAIRSGVGDLWGGLWGRNGNRVFAKAPLSFDTIEGPVSDFDADAAFARYMERRKADEEEEEEEHTPAVPRLVQPEIRRPRTQQRGFGRKAV